MAVSTTLEEASPMAVVEAAAMTAEEAREEAEADGRPTSGPPRPAFACDIVNELNDRRLSR